MKNPFDGGFKNLAEDHPELLLRLFGILQPGAKTQIKDILRELRMDRVQVDHAYLVEDESGQRIVLFEAITSWNPEKVSTMALYLFLANRQYQLPVEAHVLFMAEKYAPKNMPEKLSYEANGIRVEVSYRVTKLWELKPDLAFEQEGAPLLTWVPLLQGGMKEFLQAGNAIAELRSEDGFKTEEMLYEFATLAALRYDKEVIKGVLDMLRRKVMFSIDAFKVSWLYQEGLEEGKAEGVAIGEAKGEAIGEAKGLRAAIQMALRKKFGESLNFPELEQISKPTVLDEVFLAVLEAQTAEQARLAILSKMDASRAS